MVEFEAVLAQVLDLLQRAGRVSCRDGRVLVWIGESRPAPASGTASPAAAHVAAEAPTRQPPTTQLSAREQQPAASARRKC